MSRFGSIISTGIILLFLQPAEGRICSIAEFGAISNKAADNTKAVQNAIDACSAAGGGMVYVPAGDYGCGGLRLKSNVSLHLEAGATLWVSPKKEHYEQGNRFLYAEDQTNITIEGRGTIRGTGQGDLQRRRGDNKPKPEFRVGILRFVRCVNVMIKDITVRYSDSWTFDLEFCEKVYITGVSILNNYYRVNADGIDPVSCKNVHISNCYIIAGDDCIVCKTRDNAPCEDIVVTNCTMASNATAVKIGTESRSDFRNIHFSNCVIRDSTVGIGIYIKDGATAERISFSNCTIETIRKPELVRESLLNSIYPIFVDIEKRDPESRIGRIRDLTFSDINIVSDNGILIQGMSRPNIENLILRNITMRVDRGFDYSQRKKHVGGSTRTTEDRRRTEFARQESYATLANIKGATVDHLQVWVPEEVYGRFPRAALSLNNVEGADLSHIRLRSGGAAKGAPVVVMDNCRDGFLSSCKALPRTDVFLKVGGDKTENISVVGNDLSQARIQVQSGPEVKKTEIRR
ncbi:MAG: glycoside hydrolase family 28 protein [Planctomycetota bacterium]